MEGEQTKMVEVQRVSDRIEENDEENMLMAN